MNKRRVKQRISGMFTFVVTASLMILNTHAQESNTTTADASAVSVYSAYAEQMDQQYVHIAYPVITGIDGYDQSILDQINRTFYEEACTLMDEQEAEMESIVAEYPDSDAAANSGYDVTCDQIYVDNNIYSVMQSHYSYTGGAHGYGFSVGHSYDLNTGEELTMGGLLGCDEETAREAVVDAYRENIIDQVENVSEESIRNNFDAMAYWMTLDGMYVSIPQYVIASYAAGPQQVIVKKEDIPS